MREVGLFVVIGQDRMADGWMTRLRRGDKWTEVRITTSPNVPFSDYEKWISSMSFSAVNIELICLCAIVVRSLASPGLML